MKNKSLRFKLYLLCGFLLLIPLVVGGVSFWAMNNVTHDYSRVTEWNLPGTRTIYEVLMQNRQARMNAYQIVMPDITKERREKVAGEIENIWKEYEKSSKEYLSVPFGPGEQELWLALKEPIESGRTATLKLVDLYRKNPSDDSAERKEMIRIITEEMNPSSAKTRAAGNALREYHAKYAKENTEFAQASSAKGTKLSIMTIIISSIAGVIFVGVFANSLVKTLTSISTALAEASLQVGSGATQIASASQELSQATTEQASALEETAASIEEMNSMVSKNSDNAQQSSAISKSSHQNAQKGKETVEQMIHSIDDISKANDNIMKQINHSNDQISEIVKVISEIGNKTKVINDIVFQTKLLSFNASVEAARAGENGKGFAVVAEEVGNLAQMSGNAAAEITAMLDESIKKVEGIVSDTKSSVSRLVDEGKKKVDTGTQVAQACGDVLEEIVVSISSVANMAAEISTASVEQSLGIKEITKAMNSLDQVTQQNSATSEQAAGAAEELSGQAEALTNLVHELEIAVHGHSLMTSKKDTKMKTKKEAVVLQMKPKAAPAVVIKPVPQVQKAPVTVTKKAVGDSSIPAHDDDRFTDV